MKAPKLTTICLVGLVFLFLTACGGGGSGDGSTGGRGTLSLSLTDATTDQYQAIYITIDDIQIHLGGDEDDGGNWQSVDMPASPMTLDLLQLVNGVRENLGLTDMPAGRYTQMRLIIGRIPDGSLNILSQSHPYANYLILQGNPASVKELKIPSGFNTGVKLVNGFEIQADQTTELVLDFDAGRSIVEAGNSGNWHLKPTIKVTEMHEHAMIRGNVSDANGPVEGVRVSVQTYDPAAADPQDRVAVVTSTVTDEFGDYSIFVAPGTYLLVAYHSGFEAAVARVTALAGETLESGDTDFVLTVTDTGGVNGTVQLGDATGEKFATLSFRQDADLGGETVQIETLSLNVLNGAAYDVQLQVGNSLLVASSFGLQTQEYPLAISAGLPIQQDVALAP